MLPLKNQTALMLWLYMQMRGRVSHISSAVKTIAVFPAAGSVTMTTTAGTTRTRISVVGFHRPRVRMNIRHTHIQRHASPYMLHHSNGSMNRTFWKKALLLGSQTCGSRRYKMNQKTWSLSFSFICSWAHFNERENFVSFVHVFVSSSHLRVCILFILHSHCHIDVG